MKVANFLLSGLVVAAMGFMATGCNENPTDPTDPVTGAPGAPRSLQVVSLGASQVGLSWTAPADTGAITYIVAWAPATGGVAADSSSATVTAGFSYTASGLATNKDYNFYVYSVRSAKNSAAATIRWAGAMRYTTDAAQAATTIRMYETSSTLFGSGLTLDPPSGPKMAFVGLSNTTPNSVNLALYTLGSDPAKFEVGPAYAFTEYKNADKFDRNTFISDSSFPATSLSTWYSSKDISTRIPTDGNVRSFVLPVAQTTNGQGFFVRTGLSGSYHYARVFIKNVGGKLLQGSSPNRFVELEVSYQTNANMPYAKSAGYVETPGNVGSKVNHP